MKSPLRLALAAAAGLLLLGGPVRSDAQLIWDGNTSTAGAQDGSGTWNTTNANWYSGSADATWDSNAAVFGSSLNVGTSAVSLGAITVGTVSASGLTYRAQGNYTLTGGTITLTGATPTIDLASTAGTANNSFTINSVLAGSNGLTLTDSGGYANNAILLAGNNTFTGAVGISATNVELDSSGALGASANAVTVQQTGRLNTINAVNLAQAMTFTGTQSTTGTVTAGLNGFSVSALATSPTYSGLITLDRQGTGTGALQYVFRQGTAGQSITLSGGFTTSGTTNGNVILGATTSTATSSVIISGAVGQGAGGPNLQVVANGSGKVKLTNASGNTYAAGTVVSGGGTLEVDNASGSGTGTGGIGVSGTGTTLAGTGFLAPTGTAGLTVSTGSITAPGSGGIGTLTLALGGTTGTANFQTGSTFAFDLGAPGSSDLLAFTGGRASSVLFNNNVLNFTNAGGLAAGTYTLFTFDGSGEYTGTLSVGTGLTGYTASLVYNGSDIELQLVPEPATASLGLWALGLAGAGIAARRRLRVAR